MDGEYQEMLDDLMQVESGLSAWEIDFLESIDGAERLTEKQALKLCQIHDRLC